jgi:hypothetical protein
MGEGSPSLERREAQICRWTWCQWSLQNLLLPRYITEHNETYKFTEIIYLFPDMQILQCFYAIKILSFLQEQKTFI